MSPSGISTERPAIVWFRDDLRLADHPALQAAASSGLPLLCVYILDEESVGIRPLGGATRWWLHHSLQQLDEALSKRGGALVILRGAAIAQIEALALNARATAVYWNRRYDEAGRTVDSGLKTALKAQGIGAYSYNGNLLHEPWEVTTHAGGAFHAFGPYWRAAQAKASPEQPLPAPSTWRFAAFPKEKTPALASLQLIPRKPDWSDGLRVTWDPGEGAAQRRLDDFLDHDLAGYAKTRDLPSMPATSRLSPYLHFGEISPRQIWHQAHAMAAARSTSGSSSDLEKFLAELGWREFNHHLLFYLPDIARTNMRRGWDAMPWREDADALEAWQRGRTGYPIVDAGMRALWATGWMHNRVRMIVASFLSKHLLIDWRRGEAWFWDTLVDADAANNAANWQWVVGSGRDAAPFFRVFNPILQGEKFDPAGEYVRRWVPEIARLPDSLVHRPWEASALELAAAGLRLDEDYPLPIVAHDFGRRRALEVWREAIRG